MCAQAPSASSSSSKACARSRARRSSRREGISARLANHEVRTKATLALELTPTPLVVGDESRLSQVVVNLIVNAAQAFPTGDVDRNRIVVSTAIEEDGTVALSIRDNGPGIAPEVLDRIFDPFFTTKRVGEGTGLGLSICHGIIASLGGSIRVTSVLGKGSSFRVLLPVAHGVPAEVTPHAEASRSDAREKRGRVIVIDDEVMLARAIARSLGNEHEVIVFNDAREAVKELIAGHYDVVFCDIMMPHLRGDELYERIRALDPDLARRFVFITGGATDPRVERFFSEIDNERLDKPLTMQNLRAIVRRRL